MTNKPDLMTLLSTEPFRGIFVVLLVLLAVALHAMYLMLVERKLSGRLQRRPGPNEVGWFGVLQPIADGVKLVTKQLLVSKEIDRALFFLAPLMVMTPGLLCLVAIPIGEHIVGRDVNLGLLMILSFSSVNVIGLMLGGWGSRNKYALISSARAVAQDVAYEIPMLLIAVSIVMITHTFNLSDIVTQQNGNILQWNLFRLDHNPLMPVAFVVFFICMLAETNRAPFDIVEAESELLAGAFTEYSGMSWTYFFIAEYANIIITSSVMVVLFLGGWNSPVPFIPGGVHWFIIKLYAFLFTVIWIRWSFPRTQFYKLLNLAWKILIPLALMNLVLTAVMVKL